MEEYKQDLNNHNIAYFKLSNEELNYSLLNNIIQRSSKFYKKKYF